MMSTPETPPSPDPVARTGVVAIGRNEGERLRRCLDSLQAVADRVVYVDSGSTDSSVAMAHALVGAVVELDMQRRFTAARARNAGFWRLMELNPALDYVFFVDGDCEVMPQWLAKSSQFLDAHPTIAVVWGELRERYPQRSIYNRLCDMEWTDYPIGEGKYCGGDALIRVAGFRQVGGYRPELICGEEPEMCVRLREAGWRIWLLEEPMAIHDADIRRFGQWWRRMIRGGYGFAQWVALHGGAPERQGVRESLSVWLWSLGVPLMTLALTMSVGVWGLMALLLYPAQVTRLALSGKRSARANWLRAGALVVGKFAEAVGQAKFCLDRLRRVHATLIEYK